VVTANVLPPGVAAAIPIKVALYKAHDVLQEVLDWARRRRWPHRNPPRNSSDLLLRIE
jgi:hypothetical protein